MGEVSSLKAPIMPSKPLRTTSHLKGRAYAAAGQAGGALHTMVVLLAYQADLLKDLDQGQGLSLEEVAELCHTTDLAVQKKDESCSVHLNMCFRHRSC